MMGRTHLAIGLLAALLLLAFVPYQQRVAFTLLVLLGSILPDVDAEGSTINKRVPVTRWIPFLFEHRGFFHSIYPLVLIMAVAALAGGWQYGLYISIGYLTHLASDALTHAGIRPMHPLSKFHVKGFLSTGGILEYLLFVAVAAIDILLGIKMGIMV